MGNSAAGVCPATPSVRDRGPGSQPDSGLFLGRVGRAAAQLGPQAAGPLDRDPGGGALDSRVSARGRTGRTRPRGPRSPERQWDARLLGRLAHGDGELTHALDLASGLGQNGLWLASQGYTVDLIDISRVALTKARDEANRRRLRNVNFFQLDLDNATFPNEAALKNKPLTNAVGYMARHIDTFRKAREVVASGAMGRLIHLQSTMYVAQLFRTGQGWRYDPTYSGGGVLITQNSHLIDLLLWIFGPVAHVTGHVKRWYSTQVATLLTKMDAIKEGTGSLLDNTLIVWGRELGTTSHRM